MSEGDSIKERKGVFLHGSSAVISGQGVIFLGHSTSGKSTIVRILGQRYHVISDDKVYLFSNGDRWMMCNGDSRNKFLKEKGIRVATGDYPVTAFVRIFPYGGNELVPLDALALCRHLMDAVFEVDRQRQIENIELRKSWFATIVDVSKKIHGWKFCFKKEDSIVELISEVFQTGIA